MVEQPLEEAGEGWDKDPNAEKMKNEPWYNIFRYNMKTDEEQTEVAETKEMKDIRDADIYWCWNDVDAYLDHNLSDGRA